VANSLDRRQAPTEINSGERRWRLCRDIPSAIDRKSEQLSNPQKLGLPPNRAVTLSHFQHLERAVEVVLRQRPSQRHPLARRFPPWRAESLAGRGKTCASRERVELVSLLPSSASRRQHF